MSVDVLRYLESKGLQLKRAGGWEIHTACMFCGEDPQARGRLYINTDPDAEIPGLFECKICDKHGALPTIQRFFGDEPERSKEDDDRWIGRREIFAEAASYYHECLAEHPDVYKWLRGPDRGLTLETIQKAQLGYANGGLLHHMREKGYQTKDLIETGLVVEYSGRLQDSLREMVTIPYFVTGNVVTIRGRKWPFDGSGAKYKTLGGNSVRLYNSDAVWDATELILTEGEFDALTVKQLGFDNVVACPGAGVWQDAWDGYLAQTRRVFAVFDNDAAGNKGLAKLLERFGPKIKPVNLSEEGKCDPTTWVAQGGTPEEFQNLLSASIGGLLITVDEAEKEHSSLQGLEGLKFGIPKLDVTIAPGLLPSQVMVVLAKAGTGKTLFLLNLFQRILMCPGQEDFKILFISLEQTRGDWWERARRIYRFYNLDADDRECMDFWRERILLVDKNRLSEAELLTVLDDYRERMGADPDLVGIDYLGYWAQGFKGERYERVSDAIMSIKSVAKDRRLRVVTPHQVSRVAKYGEEPDADSARDAGVVEETADFLLTLWSPDAQLGRKEEDKSGIVSSRIGKSRHGGRGVKIDMQFAPLTLALVPEGDPLQHYARVELGLEQEHQTWEDAIFAHRTGVSAAVRRPVHVQGSYRP